MYVDKPYVLEHAHAIDDLVSGLFVDDGNHRRTQDGADKVQELCAHALQNLALSDIGKAALRSQADVLPSPGWGYTVIFGYSYTNIH